MTGSAKQSISPQGKYGLLRRFAARNDGAFSARSHAHEPSMRKDRRVGKAKRAHYSRMTIWMVGTAQTAPLSTLRILPAYSATSAPLTKHQRNQPFMVNALLSVVVYFV